MSNNYNAEHALHEAYNEAQKEDLTLIAILSERIPEGTTDVKTVQSTKAIYVKTPDDLINNVNWLVKQAALYGKLTVADLNTLQEVLDKTINNEINFRVNEVLEGVKKDLKAGDEPHGQLN